MANIACPRAANIGEITREIEVIPLTEPITPPAVAPAEEPAAPVETPVEEPVPV